MNSLSEPQVYSTVISDDTKEMIRSIVDHVMNGYDITTCDFKFALDRDNEPLIIIDLCYGIGLSKIRPTTYLTLLSATREALIAKGDIRFPMFNHVFN